MSARWTRYFWVIIGSFCLLHAIVITTVSRQSVLYGLMGLNREKNFPTLFSTGLLFLAAYLLHQIFLAAKRQTKASAKPWWILALIFVQLGLDEWFSIHDLLGSPIGRQFFPDFAAVMGDWIVTYAVLGIIFCLYFATFLWRLPRKTSLMMIASGLVFITGAMGFEHLGNAGMHYIPWLHHVGLLVGIAEEGLEMSGVLLFIMVLSQYLKLHFPTHTLSLSPRIKRWAVGVLVFCLVDGVANQVAFYFGTNS